MGSAFIFSLIAFVANMFVTSLSIFPPVTGAVVKCEVYAVFGGFNTCHLVHVDHVGGFVDGCGLFLCFGVGCAAGQEAHGIADNKDGCENGCFDRFFHG